METLTSVRGLTGVDYRIDQKIGQGATSYVFKAYRSGSDTPIALKVMREGLPEEEERTFFEEFDLMAELYKAEGDTDEHVIPKVYEVGRSQSPRYIAMELASGTSLEHLLEPDPGYLHDECDALRIAVKVAGVLDLLHTRLDRSYTDFQLRNIYWHQEYQRVMLLDWNHVSLPNQSRPQDDLLLLGAHLYRMLVGKQALYDESPYATRRLSNSVRIGVRQLQGERAIFLERRAGQRWQAISQGARAIVLRALHPDPATRFQSAAEFQKELLWLLATREHKGGDILSTITAVLQDNTPQSAEKAEILLDIAIRDNKFAKSSIDQLREFINKSKGASLRPWQAGYNFYVSGQYADALRFWEPLAESTGNLHYYRYVQAARAGMLNRVEFQEIKAQVDEAIALLNELNPSEYEQIVVMIEDILKTHPLEPLKDLLAEARAGQLIEEAARDSASSQYYEAALKYRQADQILRAMSW